jgi:hypothetical protein
VLTTCQPSTVWCSRERLPAAAAQPAKVRQSCSATDYYYSRIIISDPGNSVSTRIVSGYGLDNQAIEVRSPAEEKVFFP